MSTPELPQPARPGELEQAFALLFEALPPADRTRRVHNALALVQSGELDPNGVFVVRDGRRLAGVLVCLPVAGAGALIWPPRARHPVQEDFLIRHAVSWLRGRGVKMAQCLLAPEEVPLAASLTRNGFAHITHLWYLRYDLVASRDRLDGPARLNYRAYEADPELFHTTLLKTYEGTLDCPEITGARTVEEIIAGHRAQGTVRPGQWWLALHGTEPVGVALLLQLPDDGAWEVAYTGVAPGARRQGFGREMLVHALDQAREGGVAHLQLSVDGRNTPAWSLYRGLGFEPIDRREVFLAIWAELTGLAP
jgi:ribosomal protein S18 acetylase RimI-like enzyme